MVGFLIQSGSIVMHLFAKAIDAQTEYQSRRFTDIGFSKGILLSNASTQLTTFRYMFYSSRSK